MRFVAVAAVLLASCSDPRDCSIGVLEGDYVGSAAFDACGDLYSNDFSNFDLPAYRNAQACVIDHVQQHGAFFVRWKAQFVDTYELGAYAGLVRDGVWTLAVFQQYGGVRGAQPAERDTCTDLIAGSACSTFTTDLCLACVGRKTADPCMP